MKFNKIFTKYLALLFIILLNVQNLYVMSATINSLSNRNKKTENSNSRNNSSSKLKTKTNTKFVRGIMNFVCGIFSCKKIETDKILKNPVNLKYALLTEILEKSHYSEKDLKAYSVMKISSFLGVLPPNIIEGSYIPIIKNYVYCFLDKEIEIEKKIITEKMN